MLGGRAGRGRPKHRLLGWLARGGEASAHRQHGRLRGAAPPGGRGRAQRPALPARSTCPPHSPQSRGGASSRSRERAWPGQRRRTRQEAGPRPTAPPPFALAGERRARPAAGAAASGCDGVSRGRGAAHGLEVAGGGGTRTPDAMTCEKPREPGGAGFAAVWGGACRMPVRCRLRQGREGALLRPAPLRSDFP